jgi:hypothetical protein
MKIPSLKCWLLPFFLVNIPIVASAMDASELSEYVGYTVLASSHVEGDFQGADFDKQVRLENGWVFEFNMHQYSHAYRPEVIVLAKRYTAADFARLGVRTSMANIVHYVLLIGGESYSVQRIR